MTKVLDRLNNYRYEIIFIDDGSRDNTKSLIKQITRLNKHVNYISFTRNFGKEAAMYTGLCNAKGDYVAVMDVDLQDPLPTNRYVKILESNHYDCVATKRRDRDGEPVIRSYFAKWFYKVINRISDANVVDGARDFRLMKHQVVGAIVATKEYNRFSKGIFGWIGFQTY